MNKLTPEHLFETFGTGRIDLSRMVLQRFAQLPNKKKQTFLQPTLNFLSREDEDTIRSWGTNVLEIIGGAEAFQTLVKLLKQGNRDQKQNGRYARFFALRALERLLADSESSVNSKTFTTQSGDLLIFRVVICRNTNLISCPSTQSRPRNTTSLISCMDCRNCPYLGS